MSGTVARLPVWHGDEKRDSAEKARRREHATAWQRATGRIGRFIADEIIKPGMRLLEEIASGAKRGPAEVLEQVVLVAREHKCEADAIAPVQTLCRRLGYEMTPMVQQAAHGDLVGASADAGKEWSEGLAAALTLARAKFAAAVDIEKAEKELDEAALAILRVRAKVSARRIGGAR